MKNKQQRLIQTNRLYDTPFYIEEKTVIQDDNGIQKEIWKRKYKLFADGRSIFGREYELARETGNTKGIKLLTYYIKDIDESMRIIFNNKIYNIENIDNINFKNEELEIRATEMRLKNGS